VGNEGKTLLFTVLSEDVGKALAVAKSTVLFTELLIDVKMADDIMFVDNIDVCNGVPSRAVIDPKYTARRFRACTSPSINPDVRCQPCSIISGTPERLLRYNL